MVKSKHGQSETLDAQRIKNCLTDIRDRMYRQALLQTTVRAFFSGLMLLALLFLLNRVVPLPMQISSISWIIMSVAIGVGVCISFRHRKDLRLVARTVDEKMELRERLGTAFELIQTAPQSEFAQRQIQDTAEVVGTLEITKISPYRVPKLMRLFPIPLLLIGFSFAIPPFYAVPQPLADLQQAALDKAIQNLDGKQVRNSTLQQQISDTIKKLEATKDLDTAQRSLSDLKKEVRKQQSEQNAITEATAATQNFRGMDANQLAAELQTFTEQAEIPPELQAELMKLFERLAENLPEGPLNDSLNQIQGKSVTPETLQDIIDALEMMEKTTDLTQLEAQLTANQKELALATLEIDTQGGGVANSDGAPGQNTGGSEVQGTLEGALNADPPSELQTTDAEKVESETDTTDSTPSIGEEIPTLQIDGQQLILTAKVSGHTQGFSDTITGEVSNNDPVYLPFSDVVLNAERAYAEAVNNNRIPVRYQAQIKAYLEAISQKNEKEPD
ncbi:hypothetical protein F4054_00165 [Candidatus Poribacteria bacterium]|nr:hypothetical protein [Candidatus Poribacteria bacterium]MYK20660.1 hypothetical protein [Candidatus Poribacteria bacterium]